MTKDDVIRGLAVHAKGEDCDGCPYCRHDDVAACIEKLCLDAIVLLTQEVPKEVKAE